MDVVLEKPEVVTGGDMEEQHFGIGNASMVITILRSKLYSNPIKTVIQEISSNARDANRENGKADVPIRIKLPDIYDNTLKISDDGIGISPDRMGNVFIKYGNSTKRGTNLTGGFGIGAKSMFAYTDTFNIITTTNENGVIYTREYQAYIDESNVGKLALLNTEITPDKTTGTTMSMAVKPGDFRRFREEARDLFSFWSTLPEINSDLDLKKAVLTRDLDFGTWFATKTRYFDSTFVALVDEIPYPIRTKLLFDKDENENILDDKNFVTFLNSNGQTGHKYDQTYCQYVFPFKVNEVPVSASRDELDYTPDGIEKIKALLYKAYEQLVLKFKADYDKCFTYKAAVKLWYNDDNRLSFVPRHVKFYWYGIELNEEHHVSEYVSDYKARTKVAKRYSVRDTSDKITVQDKISISTNNVLSFSLLRGVQTPVFFTTSNNKRIPTFFREFHKTHPSEDMIVILEDLIDADKVDTLKKILVPLPIESINPNLKITTVKKKLNLSFVFKPTYYQTLRKGRRRYSSYATYELKKLVGVVRDTGVKRYYVVFDEKTEKIKFAGKELRFNDFMDFAHKLIDYDKVLGVNSILNVEPFLEPLENFFKEYIEKQKQDRPITDSDYIITYKFTSSWRYLWESGEIDTHVEDKEGIAYRYIRESMRFKDRKTVDKYSDYRSELEKYFPEEMKNTFEETGLRKLYEEFRSAYPLLSNSSIDGSMKSALTRHCIWYINEVDKILWKKRTAKALQGFTMKPIIVTP